MFERQFRTIEKLAILNPNAVQLLSKLNLVTFVVLLESFAQAGLVQILRITARAAVSKSPLRPICASSEKRCSFSKMVCGPCFPYAPSSHSLPADSPHLCSLALFYRDERCTALEGSALHGLRLPAKKSNVNSEVCSRTAIPGNIIGQWLRASPKSGIL